MSSSYCTYHLLPHGSTLGTPRGKHRNPGVMVVFWYFFFPDGGGSCLVLETTSLDHGDNYPQDLFKAMGQQGEKCFIWFDGRCVKLSKKCAKKLDTFVCYFCQ